MLAVGGKTMGPAIVLLSLSLVPSGTGWGVSSRPFTRLFQLAIPTQAGAPAAELPRRVCGMTVLRPAPEMISRMPMLRPPADREFTLRTERPAVCAGEASAPRP
jgi:hypothetical protein